MGSFISIIMPVYNAALFLDRAIKSLVDQDMKDWELIAVNDGSKDNSGDILDWWASEDSRIKVFHQENQGVSATRQKGVLLAQGEYSIHVDADDWVEPDYLSSLLDIARQIDADFVWCDCFTNENGLWQMPIEETRESLIKSMLEQKMWGMLWNKLIRTSICQREDVRFPEGCSMWEDLAFVVQCLLHCQNVAHCNKPLYHYNLCNTGSLVTKQQDKEIAVEWHKAINCIDNAFTKENCKDQYLYELNSLKLFSIRNYIDDLRFRDYDKFINTYPEAIEHIDDYPEYPKRLKVCAWLIRHNLSVFVPILWRVYLKTNS